MIGRFLLLLPGVLLLAGAAWTGVDTAQFCASATHTEGVVRADLRGEGGTHRPRVTFTTPDGQRHQFTGPESPWPFQEGQRVPVLYDESLPERAAIDTIGQAWFLTLVLAGLGLLFTLAPGIPLSRRLKRQHRNEWLKANGRLIHADFSGVTGEHTPYFITAQWLDPATRQLHVFRSVDIWFNPTAQATQKMISVLFDPADSTRYWMDLSFLTGYVDN